MSSPSIRTMTASGLPNCVRNRKVKPFVRIGDERIRSSEEAMARICTVFFLVFATSASAASGFGSQAGLWKSPAARAAVR